MRKKSSTEDDVQDEIERIRASLRGPNTAEGIICKTVELKRLLLKADAKEAKSPGLAEPTLEVPGCLPEARRRKSDEETSKRADRQEESLENDAGDRRGSRITGDSNEDAEDESSKHSSTVKWDEVS